jgi:hypothetical protein
MKWFYALPFCLIATSAPAQTHQFRGDFVGTYMAEAGFLDKLPSGTELNCAEQLCSSSKAVRIYVFRDGYKTKKFWSTDYSDVMFDEPEQILSCGPTGHIVYYDDSNQLLFRDNLCHRETAEPRQERQSTPVLSQATQ